MSFWTWNPNHSDHVREILKHATEKERTQFARLSMIGGLILATSVMLAFTPVVGVAVATQMQSSMRVLWILAMAGVPVACLNAVIAVAIVRRMVRNTLVTFEWAKEQGITKDSLKLDRWG